MAYLAMFLFFMTVVVAPVRDASDSSSRNASTAGKVFKVGPDGYPSGFE